MLDTCIDNLFPSRASPCLALFSLRIRNHWVVSKNVSVGWMLVASVDRGLVLTIPIEYSLFDFKNFRKEPIELGNL